MSTHSALEHSYEHSKVLPILKVASTCSCMHKWSQQYDDVSNFLSAFQVKHPVEEKGSVDQITRPKYG